MCVHEQYIFGKPGELDRDLALLGTVRLFRWMCLLCENTRVCVCMYDLYDLYVYVICVYVYVCVCLCVFVYVCICMYVCTYV
jgi:hypothetical protein